MKIYTRIEMDMATGEVLHEESFEHHGEVAECKGGGGGSGVDKAYNRRMARIAESQQDMAEEMYNIYKTGYQGGPSQLEMEQKQLEANMELIPEQTGLQKEQIGSQRELLPEQTDLQESQIGLQEQQIGAQEELLPLQTDLQRQRLGLQGDVIQAQQGMVPQASDAVSGFMQEAQEGVDINERMGLAQADVAGQYQDAGQEQRLQASRMGIKPGSGAFAKQSRGLATNKARDIASARTRARSKARKEDFQRQGQAAQMGLGLMNRG